jgi:hypothetical protein
MRRREVQAGELAPLLTGGGIVGAGGVLNKGKETETAVLDLHLPFSRLGVPTDPTKSRAVVRSHGRIRRVFGVGHAPQIPTSIVQEIPVDVVSLVTWLASHDLLVHVRSVWANLTITRRFTYEHRTRHRDPDSRRRSRLRTYEVAVIHLPSVALGGVLVASLAVSGWAAMAQESPTPSAAETVEVTIGAFTFDVDTREPLLSLPVSRTTTGDGSFVSYDRAIQDSRGEFHGATRCDDVAVACLPFTSPAKGGLRLADSGDAIPLAGDGSQ